MKRLLLGALLIGVLGLGLPACNPGTGANQGAGASPTPSATTESVDQIAALLQQHDDAMNRQDLDGVINVFAPGPKTVAMGTGPGERWQGRDEIRGAYTEIFKDFDKGTSTHNCDWKTGQITGNTAWLAAMCKFSDSKAGKKREYELNVSGALEKQGDKWYFTMLHYSNLTGGGGSN